MNRLLEAINVKSKAELEYVKGLRMDPDFEKIDPNSGEDLVTQLAKIKKLDKEELGKRISKTLLLQYLTNKHYNQMSRILEDPDVSTADKMALLGMRHSPSAKRKVLLFCAMLFDAVFFTLLYILLVPAPVSVVFCILGFLAFAASEKFREGYARILVKRYFKILGWKE